MPPALLTSEGRWTAALLCGLALVVGMTLWPLLWPQPRVPTVTRTALPPVSGPAAPEYPQTASVTPLISGRLNLNAATQEQLEALPGVGPKLAEAIIRARPLRSLADLDAVKGVGEKSLTELEPLVTF
ncbi:ComEA family DNA-binding protein [Deinococcus lacus]|uniref:ComEA family DNA-binding protein n=1 Tax=Deinococcus lacus TaxID=392561 RepID=A0ABW1YDX5_9DEIO